ncbi:MAG: hypothetical protein AAFR57_16495 [Pseudomonadota bacterium]
MRITFLAPLILLAACAETAVPDGYTRISEEAEFVDKVVGKRLTIDGNFVVIAADGTFAGNFNDTDLAGIWNWSEDGYWCRTITVGPQRAEDCQLFEIFGTALRGTRDRGDGVSFVYEIEG